MNFATWLGPWDLHSPITCIDHLRVAYAYHGSRLYLPRDPQRRVLELPPSALYFTADPTRFGRLQPFSAGPMPVIDVPHSAWLVLCHNDHLGPLHPECCIRNAFDEPYTYALCPAHPDTVAYAVELCRQAAQQPNVRELDIEALSFMGFDHQGLHEKRGVALSPNETELLSVCFCDDCAPQYPHLRAAVRDNREVDLEPVYAWRRHVVLDLLRRIRAACPNTALNLRVAPDHRFTGGKTAFAPSDLAALADLVDAITLTFFGTPPAAMAATLAQIPELPYPLHVGFVFHAPDCLNDAQRDERLAIIADARIQNISFYSWSLAGNDAIAWLSTLEEKF